MNFQDFLRSIPCACQVCLPPDEQVEIGIKVFGGLVASGGDPNSVIRQESEHCARPPFARVEDMDRTEDLEVLAQDLCTRSLNPQCLKVAAVAKLVRAVPFWGAIAENIQKGPTPEKRRVSRKRSAR